jgi:hypothetical protein
MDRSGEHPCLDKETQYEIVPDHDAFEIFGIRRHSIADPCRPVAQPCHGRNARKLRFSALEFNAPSDPLLWSSTPNRVEQPTPASDIQYAVNQLNAAIPVGLSASEAHARLQAAGRAAT